MANAEIAVSISGVHVVWDELLAYIVSEAAAVRTLTKIRAERMRLRTRNMAFDTSSDR